MESPTIPNPEPTVCKYCQSTNTRKYGIVEGTQTYFCNDCRRKFHADDHLFRMKTPASQVEAALGDYYKGKSINDIRDSLNQLFQNNPSSKTVYEWVDKYTDEAVKQFREYHPENLGNTWLADETVLRVAGRNVWVYDIIDEKTRMILATRLAPSRTTADAEAVMWSAAKLAGKNPKVVVTDQNYSYLDGIERAFGGDTEHIQSKPFAHEENTQLIERWHETLKERTKVMRGLKSLDSAISF